MGHQSTFDQGVQPAISRGSLRFPTEDGDKSLAEMAQRDFESALLLLAERARYITGASGAAIALRDGEAMICQASAGASAPELGSHLQVDSGLTGESIRTRQILRCDDAANDSRVNRESCLALGVKSVMVVPLLREQEVLGVFELLAERACAFEERDVAALQRLSGMVLTALEHADAASCPLNEVSVAQIEEPGVDETPSVVVAAAEPNEATVSAIPATEAREPEVVSELADGSVQPPPLARTHKIRACEACGFPVSEGRTLCLDCEEAGISPKRNAPIASAEAPVPLSQFAAPHQQGWLQSHIYTIGTVLVVALTVVLLVLKLR